MVFSIMRFFNDDYGSGSAHEFRCSVVGYLTYLCILCTLHLLVHGTCKFMLDGLKLAGTLDLSCSVVRLLQCSLPLHGRLTKFNGISTLACYSFRCVHFFGMLLILMTSFACENRQRSQGWGPSGSPFPQPWSLLDRRVFVTRQECQQSQG